MKNRYYRVYGKVKGQTRYQALDMSTVTQVSNLMYASFYTEDQLGALKEYVADLNKQLAGKAVLEIRAV